MIEGYHDRLIRPPRGLAPDFIREGRPAGPQARPGARRGESEANNSPEDEGADAPSQDT